MEKLQTPLSSSFHTARRAPRIPMEDFFRIPEKCGFQLSPDGTRYSWLEPRQGQLNIYIAEIGGAEGKRITSSAERDIGHYGWLSDDQLFYMQDQGGDENYHLFLISLQDDQVKDMTPFEGVRCHLTSIIDENALEDLFITLNKRDKRVFDLYRLDRETGEITLVSENPGSIFDWRSDHQEKLRLALEEEGTLNRVLYRETEQDAWKTIFETDFHDHVIPLEFTDDNSKLYIISDLCRDKLALYEYDLKTAQQKLIYEQEDANVLDIIYSYNRDELLGVYYSYSGDKLQRHFFDKETEDFYNMLQAQFPGLFVDIASKTYDENRMILSVSSDRVPERLYHYDKDEPGKFTLLSDRYSWLREEQLAEMKPISYSARDGLTIHGFLTLPVGVEPEKLPVIVVVHGGPEYNDIWNYSARVQFFANRGMAVLQVNYRISTCDGKAFWQAGFKQWGLKQQDDITDGVKWLIDQGIADPERIAIFGASYGGYAVLMGLIKTPELFACGVDYVGITSLFTLFDSLPPHWEISRKRLYETIGNPETDAEQFKATSPVFLADKIQAPLFIAQGANDPRVVKAQSDAMVEALRKRGVAVQYMVKENEGHGFRNEENRLDFYRAVEEFLTKYLNLE